MKIRRLYFKTAMLIIVLIFAIINCSKTTDSESYSDIEYYFNLADSNGMERTIFNTEQDVFFSMCNSGPIASFNVYMNDSLIGTSDDGYDYAQALVDGELDSGDTLKCCISWYSNNNHDSLATGNYCAIIHPNIYILDIVPSTCLDSIYFQIH